MTTSQFGTPMTPSQYADNWEGDSQLLASNGQYRWMARQLGPQDIVLEIGCGTGISTIELVRSAGCKVVVVEESSECISRAQARLIEAGMSASICPTSSLSSLMFNADEQVKFFAVDFLDTMLLSAMPNNFFSAVVCWLMGTCPDVLCRHLGKSVSEIEQCDPANYKVKVLAQCFVAARTVLRANGKVHLVDRYALPSWKQKDEFRMHVATGISEIAGDAYVVTKDNVYFNRIDTNFGVSRIQYVRPSNEGIASVKVVGSVLAELR